MQQRKIGRERVARDHEVAVAIDRDSIRRVAAVPAEIGRVENFTFRTQLRDVAVVNSAREFFLAAFAVIGKSRESVRPQR